MADDLGGGVAHHHARQAALAATADDDEIGLVRPGTLQDALIGIGRFDGDGLGIDSGFGGEGGERFSCAFLGFFPQIRHQGTVFRVVQGNGQAGQMRA